MANYPGSLSTNANLYIAVNGLQTTLAVACTSGDTTLTLTSTTGFPTTGLVTIDNTEVVSYTGVSGATITGCTRGADGTTAASHPIGVTVGLTVVAAHHNLLKDEIIAIETALGISLANVFPATPTTGTGNVVLQTSPTITTPTINSPTLVTPALGTPASGVMTNVTGLPLTTGVTGILPNANTTATPNATASTIVSRDANANAKINEIIQNFSTTVTAAGTTTLTAASSPLQQFTGTTTQTVVLPDATTLSVGFYFTVMNRSTGAVTVNKNGGTLQATVPASSQSTFVCTSVGSAAGTWDTSTSSAGGITAYREDYVVGTALNNYTGSTTVFNLVTPYSVGGNSLVVTLDGDVQTKGATIDYQETNSTTVTFNNALVTGEKVSFIFQTATSSGGTVNSGTSGQLAYYAATGPTVSGTNDPAAIASINTTFIGMGRNRLINGDMLIDQQRAGVLATVNSTSDFYVVDGMRADGQTTDGVYTLQVVGTTPPTGFSRYLHLVVTTADASITAAQTYKMVRPVEGYFFRDCLYGTASAKTFTYSFWVRSSLTGTFSVSFVNGNDSRSYTATYTISAANTWEFKSIVFAGDASGSSIALTTNSALTIIHPVGIGTNQQTATVNQWVAGEFRQASTGTQIISTNGATFDLTGCQLEMGSLATSFEYRPFNVELGLCLRYYEKSYDLATAPATVTDVNDVATSGAQTGATTVEYSQFAFKVQKRASPTMTFYSRTDGASGKWDTWSTGGTRTERTVSADYSGTNGFSVFQTAALDYLAVGHFTADARL